MNADRHAEATGQCGALTLGGEGKPCQMRCGFRTDHPGRGRCYLHGGRTPVTTGIYSGIQHERLKDLIAVHLANPDPLNLLNELAALRAMFQDFVERHDEYTAALLAWHASWDPINRPIDQNLLLSLGNVVDDWEERITEGGELSERQNQDARRVRAWIDAMRGKRHEDRPRQVLDIADAYRILSEIGKMVERMEKIRSANAISRPELNRIAHQWWAVVEAWVTDQKQLDEIKRGLLAIRTGSAG